MESNPFTPRLLAWYARHRRKLPWRNQQDPYAVWVSEIMLQQTRVNTVISYYERWMSRFPSIEALAAASLDEILSAWEGMGYYHRARNMHKAAQMVMQDYQGKFPDEARLLVKLPGIGRYTAGAIASIAIGRDEPTLDGNIRRVLARYFNIAEDVHSFHGEHTLWKLAAQYLPEGHAGEYNQALMDLGATLCKPKLPACDVCPLEATCQARALGVQEHRPYVRPKLPIPHYVVTAAVIGRDGRWLITRRPLQGLLGGLWEFPGGKQQPGEDLPACLSREIHEELGVQIRVGSQIGVYRHAYTHFRVTLHAFRCELVAGEPHPFPAIAMIWALPKEMPHYPMGKIDRQISQSLQSLEDT